MCSGSKLPATWPMLDLACGRWSEMHQLPILPLLVVARRCRELDPCYAPNGLASEPGVLLAATSFGALLLGGTPWL